MIRSSQDLSQATVHSQQARSTTSCQHSHFVSRQCFFKNFLQSNVIWWTDGQRRRSWLWWRRSSPPRKLWSVMRQTDKDGLGWILWDKFDKLLSLSPVSVTVMAVMNEDNGDNDGPGKRSLITDQMIADISPPGWPIPSCLTFPPGCGVVESVD